MYNTQVIYLERKSEKQLKVSETSFLKPEPAV